MLKIQKRMCQTYPSNSYSKMKREETTILNLVFLPNDLFLTYLISGIRNWISNIKKDLTVKLVSVLQWVTCRLVVKRLLRSSGGIMSRTRQ